MRTPAQRGPIGNWLRDQRIARGWTQVETVKNLTTAGIPTAQSVYSEWESGTRIPAERNLAKLEAFFGPMTESPGGRDTLPGLSPLLERLDRQAEILTALLSASLRTLDMDVMDLEARLRAVEATQRLLHPELDEPGSSTLPAPRATRG